MYMLLTAVISVSAGGRRGWRGGRRGGDTAGFFPCVRRDVMSSPDSLRVGAMLSPSTPLVLSPLTRSSPCTSPKGSVLRAGLPFCVPPKLMLTQLAYARLLDALAPGAAAFATLETAGRTGRCAVVGGGAQLAGARLGPAIDAHDLVIRMNDAPASTGGDEIARDVGRRTDVRLAYPESLSAAILANDTGHLLLVAFKPRDLGYLHEALLRLGAPPPAWDVGLPFWRRLEPTPRVPAERVSLLSPAVAWTAAVVASEHARRSRDPRVFRAPRRWPQLGFVAAVLALSVCTHVDLFGFTLDHAGAGGGGHYYSSNRARAAAGRKPADSHSLAVERSVLRHLSSHGALCVDAAAANDTMRSRATMSRTAVPARGAVPSDAAAASSSNRGRAEILPFGRPFTVLLILLAGVAIFGWFAASV